MLSVTSEITGRNVSMENEPKRVAMMHRQIGPYHGARLREATSFLRKKGVELIVIETAAKTENYSQWEKIGDEGFRRKMLFPGERWDAVAPKRMRTAVACCLDLCQPDVVVVTGWMARDMLAAIQWCRRNGRGVVVMTDSNVDDRPRRWCLEFVKRRILSRCDAALAAGKTSVDYVVMLGMPRKRIRVGVDVVDNEFFQQRAEELRAEPQKQAAVGVERPFFVTPARFIEEKNLLGAMDAYAAYVTEFGEEAWDWVLCGDGPLRKQIEDKLQALSLEARVHLVGFVNTAEMAKYYAWCDGLWLPSTMETWGLVVNEAMAAAVPVLVSNQAHCHHDLVVSGENGWTFNPFSTEEMKQALGKLSSISEQERSRMGEAGQRIIADWGLDRFARTMWEAAQAAYEVARNRSRTTVSLDRLFLTAALHRK